MAQSYETILSTIEVDYSLADKEWGDSGIDLGKASDYYNDDKFELAQKYILYCLIDIRQCLHYLLTDHATGHNFSSYGVPLLFHLFLDPDYAPEIPISWKSICEAWVKDDFEGRFWTIGIIDRMRQIMWDEPFDLTWAARPEQKEI